MQMSPEELEKRRAAANPPKDELADELLETGQEEVFSRTEVESGNTEHQGQSGRHAAPRPRAEDWKEPESDQVRRDEEQTERQAPNDASPGEAGG
jgi:hypothetical protein